MDKPMVTAVGTALALIGTLLERAAIVQKGEIAELFALYSVVSNVSDPDKSDILAIWASMLREVAEPSPLNAGSPAERLYRWLGAGGAPRHRINVLPIGILLAVVVTLLVVRGTRS